MEVNSQEYWDHRFDTDWVQKLGNEQSTFFAQVAIDAFPQWLKTDILEKRLSICDWGCALGDGTNVIKQTFPESNITGFDFSAVAIDKANEIYPHISFKSDDLLLQPVNDKFDIVFSSNTLEHFSNPWQALLKLSTNARLHLVIETPYKQYERDTEHMYTFDEKSILYNIGNTFFLTHVEITNTADFLPTYWNGLQVLLVYSHIDCITNKRLKVITETDLSFIEFMREQKNLIHAVGKIQEGKVDELRLLLNRYEKESEQNNFQLVQKTASLQQLQQELADMKQVVIDAGSDREQLIAQHAAEINSLNIELATLKQQAGAKVLLEAQLEEKKQSEIALITTIAELKVFIQQLEAGQKALETEHKREVQNLKIALDDALQEVKAKKVLEEQLNEKKQIIENLKKDLNAKEQALHQAQITSVKLEGVIGKLQQHIEWYKVTYETRSILGLLKQKMIKTNAKE